MNCLEIKDRIATELYSAELAAHVLVIRHGSDGQSLVYIVEADRAGAFAQALAGAGFSVSVEDSSNPAFTSLRVR